MAAANVEGVSVECFRGPIDDGALAVPVRYAESSIRSQFQIAERHPLEIIVVGSAKLGFSIAEKFVPGRNPRPRYREFDPYTSDVDLAVVCQKLYFDIWRDLSTYSHSQSPFPWDSQLAKYMVVGWIRPDHFPKLQGPIKCMRWWELFQTFSNSTPFNRRKVRGGLYFHRDFLNQYQQRAVISAQKAEAAGDVF
jgi:hypothetical protein